jgi:hypothetical protein
MTSDDQRPPQRPEKPEPRIEERIVHGQVVKVKVYPPLEDPSWSEWLRSNLRASAGHWMRDRRPTAAAPDEPGEEGE